MHVFTNSLDNSDFKYAEQFLSLNVDRYLCVVCTLHTYYVVGLFWRNQINKKLLAGLV